jgi:hypothetical protein
MKSRARVMQMLAVIGCAALLPSVAWFQTASAAHFAVSKETAFWATFWIMTVTILFAYLFVALGLLRSPSWQLGDALSEEGGNQPDPLPAGMKPILVASSSRLIALLGLMSILGVFLGFGYYFLYLAFASGISQAMPDMKSLIYYLLGGL